MMAFFVFCPIVGISQPVFIANDLVYIEGMERAQRGAVGYLENVLEIPYALISLKFLGGATERWA
jgi:hypothetical protein